MATTTNQATISGNALVAVLEEIGQGELASIVTTLERSLATLGYGVKPTLTIKPEGLKLALQIAQLPDDALPLLEGAADDEAAWDRREADYAVTSRPGN